MAAGAYVVLRRCSAGCSPSPSCRRASSRSATPKGSGTTSTGISGISACRSPPPRSSGWCSSSLIDRLRARWLPLITHPRTGRWTRYALAAATALYAFYGYILRPRILTGHAGSLSSYIGAPTPAGHNANLVRLGWYWSPLGVLLIALGATLLIGRDLNRLTGGLLAFALVHTVIFVNETYTDDRYIYALRHYVPVVMPIFALFAAYAVWNGGPILIGALRGWPTPSPSRNGRGARSETRLFLGHRRLTRVPPPVSGGGHGGGLPLTRALGLLAAAALVLFFVATRAGTWTVQRYAGVEGQLNQIAQQFPANSLLLFSGERDQPHLLATPLQFIYGRSAFVISTNNPRGDLIEAWLNRESATHPVYVLMGNDGGKLFLPACAPGAAAAVRPRLHRHAARFRIAPTAEAAQRARRTPCATPSIASNRRAPIRRSAPRR